MHFFDSLFYIFSLFLFAFFLFFHLTAMESTLREKKEECYDEVYFDSDQDSDQETSGIGLPGKDKSILALHLSKKNLTD